jgi:hypothetical protein
MYDIYKLKLDNDSQYQHLLVEADFTNHYDSVEIYTVAGETKDGDQETLFEGTTNDFQYQGRDIGQELWETMVDRVSGEAPRLYKRYFTE